MRWTEGGTDRNNTHLVEVTQQTCWTQGRLRMGQAGITVNTHLVEFTQQTCWICSPQTWDSQPEPNRIQAGFAQYDLGCLWKSATKSESGKLVVCRLHSARTRPSDSCTLICFWTRCVCPKPDQAIQIRSGSVLHNMTWAFFGRTELNWMQEVGSSIYDLASPILAICWP